MNDRLMTIKDPVCEMMVDAGDNEVVLDGLHYAFCSNQCRERFIARPGLYIGARQRPAPKERGVKLMRQRRVAIGEPLTDEQSTALVAALRKMMGVVDVRYLQRRSEPGNSLEPLHGAPQPGSEAAEIEITYDLLEATVAQLERRIAEVGGHLRDGFGQKLRRDFIYYIEECELTDIETDETTVENPQKPRGSSWA